MRILMVGGRFDNENGHISSVFRTISRAFLNQAELDQHNETTVFNGGNVAALPQILDHVRAKHVVLWMPEISNEVEKTLPRTIPRDCHVLEFWIVADKDKEIGDLLDEELRGGSVDIDIGKTRAYLRFKEKYTA